MALQIIPRTDVPLAPPRRPLTRMYTPQGWVIHYVGGTGMSADINLEQAKSLWRRLQADAFANTKEGYIDIPYSFGVSPTGHVLEGRGWDNQSGANGSSGYNEHAWAACYLGGVGTPVTAAAKAAFTALTQEGARRAPAVNYVKGHRDVFGTACPGNELYGFVPYLHAHLHTAGPTPPPTPTTEIDDMLISAPKWQQTKPSRTPTVGLGDEYTILARNGARFIGQTGTATRPPLAAGMHLVGLFETFNPDGSKEGFTVQATKDASGNADFHYPWVKKS